MLVIFCSGSGVERVRGLIDAHEVHGYTEIPAVLGSGTTGRHMGTRAFPGTTAVILAAVDTAKADEVLASLEELSKSCTKDEGMRVLVLPVERMF